MLPSSLLVAEIYSIFLYASYGIHLVAYAMLLPIQAEGGWCVGKNHRDRLMADVETVRSVGILFFSDQFIWYDHGHYFPSKIEWDLTNGPLRKLLELLDSQV